jgi:transposase InsO family protein
VKCVDGSVVETHGTVDACISEGQNKVKFTFQLVNKQVDLAYDGIIGMDFLRATGAKICFKTNKVVFDTPEGEWTKAIGKEKGNIGSNRVCTVKIPRRSELITRIPVENGIEGAEGVIEKVELKEDVYLANALIKVTNNQAITSILNTTETEAEVEIPEVKWEEYQEPKEECFHSSVGSLIMTTGSEKGRAQKVLEALTLDHLNPEEKRVMTETCKDYQDIFYLPGDRLSCAATVKHSINVVPGTSPVHTRPYRLPEAQKAEIENQVDKLLKEGIISESSSPWNSPLLIVPKRTEDNEEKKWRLVVDFRRLNEKTIGDAYPLPDITEILDQLGQSRYFSCLDLVMGYHQIELEERDKEKTAFSTKNGHWEYNRLPFGLKTAPATFQRMINTVLSGLTGTRCFVFLDDIVVYAKSLSEHDAKLREVLGRIRKYKLKLQPSKCKFLRTEVGYLGHLITEEGVRPDSEKVKVIENFSRPDTAKKLKGFLGMTGYYRKFIGNYSKIAAPLYLLLKGDAPFVWGEDQENAFRKLKEKLISKPILQYPDFTKEFVLTTDASNDGIGAILSQGQIGKDLPIAYASRNLNKAERNYTTSEKELLAIVWGIKHFRPYLYGRKFKVASDHKPLLWIMNIKDPGSRLLRWRIKLEEYDYEIVYKKGALNTNADALSRISGLVLEDEVCPKEEISPEKKKQILYEFHDAPMAGHRGMNSTYKAVKSNYSWPNMKQEVEDYVRRCKSCQTNKILGPRGKAPMEISTTARQPFEKCCLDIVGPLPETQAGNKYILTFQDELSKFLIATPIARQDAETVSKEFVKHVILRVGTPRRLLTDQGSNFLSELFRNTCKLLRIQKLQTTPFHPESNGSLERSHRVLKEYLRHYIEKDQSNWDEWVPYAVYVFNNSTHTATQYSPFELVYGFKAIMPSVLQENHSVQYNYDDYVAELKNRLQTAHLVARERLLHAKEKSKEHYDKTSKPFSFQAGEKVLLYDETVRRGRSRKLCSQWLGPYEIVSIDKVNATIKKGRHSQKVHVNRLKHFID